MELRFAPLPSAWTRLTLSILQTFKSPSTNWYDKHALMYFQHESPQKLLWALKLSRSTPQPVSNLIFNSKICMNGPITYWCTIKTIDHITHAKYTCTKAYKQCLEWDGHHLPCLSLHFPFLVRTMYMKYLNSHFPQTIRVYSLLNP